MGGEGEVGVRVVSAFGTTYLRGLSAKAEQQLLEQSSLVYFFKQICQGVGAQLVSPIISGAYQQS